MEIKQKAIDVNCKGTFCKNAFELPQHFCELEMDGPRFMQYLFQATTVTFHCANVSSMTRTRQQLESRATRSTLS